MPWGRAMGETLRPPSSFCGREAAESCWAQVSSRESAESCRWNLGYLQPLALFWREGCSWSQERAGGIRPVPGAAPGLLPALLSSARAPRGARWCRSRAVPRAPRRTPHCTEPRHPQQRPPAPMGPGAPQPSAHSRRAPSVLLHGACPPASHLRQKPKPCPGAGELPQPRAQRLHRGGAGQLPAEEEEEAGEPLGCAGWDHGGQEPSCGAAPDLSFLFSCRTSFRWSGHSRGTRPLSPSARKNVTPSPPHPKLTLTNSVIVLKPLN